jgi:hypothetical protein
MLPMVDIGKRERVIAPFVQLNGVRRGHPDERDQNEKDLAPAKDRA